MGKSIAIDDLPDDAQTSRKTIAIDDLPDAPGAGDVAVSKAPKATGGTIASQEDRPGIAGTALLRGAYGIAGELPSKAAAAISATVGSGPEESWSDRYDAALESTRRRNENAIADNPGTAGTSELAFSLLPYAAPGVALKGTGAALANGTKAVTRLDRAAHVGKVAAIGGAQGLAKDGLAGGIEGAGFNAFLSSLGAAPRAASGVARVASFAARATPNVVNTVVQGGTLMDPEASAKDKVMAGEALALPAAGFLSKYMGGRSRAADEIRPLREGAESDAQVLAQELQTRQAKFDEAKKNREQKRVEDLAAVRHQLEMADAEAAHKAEMQTYAEAERAAKEAASQVKADADRMGVVESEAARMESQRKAEIARMEKAAKGEGLTEEEAKAKADATLRAQYGEAYTRITKMIQDAENGITSPTPEQLAEMRADRKHLADSLLRNTPESVSSARTAREIGFDARSRQIKESLLAKANAGDPEAKAALEQLGSESPDFKADAERAVAASEVQKRADRVRRLREAAKNAGIDTSDMSDEALLADGPVRMPEAPDAPNDDAYKRQMMELRATKLSAEPFDARAEGARRTTPTVIEDAISQGRENVASDLKDPAFEGRDVLEQYLRERKPSLLQKLTGGVLGSIPGGTVGGPLGAAAGSAVGTLLSSPKESHLHSNFLGRSMTRWGLDPGDASVRRYSTPNEAAATLRDVESGLRKTRVTKPESWLPAGASSSLSSGADTATVAAIMADPEFREWLRKRMESRK